jgi:hypothetical protein
MTPPGLPLPSSWSELEHNIVWLARAMLHDPHAFLYGRQGDEQHGLDILATDRRPGGSGRRWAFQAKDFRSQKLVPGALEEMAKLLEGFPERKDLDTFIVVTTARVSTKVRDKAKELEKRLGLVTFAVWDWDQFSEHMVHHCGSGPWLAAAERDRLRDVYCGLLRREYREAGLLYPLRIAEDPGIRLEDVLIPPILHRASPHDPSAGVPAGIHAPPPTLREGPLAAWLESTTGKKSFLLVLAPMGGGKTVLVMNAVADLAEKAVASGDAPLPLRVPAAQMAGRQLDAVVAELLAEELKPLWDDPMCSWVIFVDGLDEVDEVARPIVEQQLASLMSREKIVALVVTCRETSVRPQMLSDATRLNVRPWNGRDETHFAKRWRQARESNLTVKAVRVAPTDVDTSLRENPLCCTLLAIYGPGKGGRPSRARLFRKLTDGMFRVWAERRKGRRWQDLQVAFENLALATLKAGGRPIRDDVVEAVLANATASESVEEILEIAERTLGLIRRVGDRGWEFTYRAVAEYLAAGAVVRDATISMRELAEEPWAGEVVRLALDRQSTQSPSRVRNSIRRMLVVDAGDDADVALRRLLVATRVGRDLGAAAGPVARAVARHVVAAATDEISAWHRRFIAQEVSALAVQAGPLWLAVWSTLKPRLLATDSRAAWLATRDDDDPAFWTKLLKEQDIAVRAVATERLARWKDQPEVLSTLVLQVFDEGYEGGQYGAPAVHAGIALRDAPRDDLFVLMRPLLVMALRAGHQFCAGGAALALSPGEAPTAVLLNALRWLAPAIHDPAVTLAIVRLGREPEGRAWLGENWPDAPTDEAAPGVAWPLPVFTGNVEPLSYHAAADVWAMVAPALQHSEVRAQIASSAPDLAAIHAACAVACTAPQAALDLLKLPRDIFFPFSAQEALGAAAVEHPEIARALIRRWRNLPPEFLRTSYPGLALDPLAGRGDAEAVQAYAEWLPLNPAMMPLVPAYCPPSQAALAQPGIRQVARELARRSWDEMNAGRLHGSTLVSHLYGLWPAWEEDAVVREGLIAWAEGDDKEHFDIAVRAWLNGNFPPAVARALVKWILGCGDGSIDAGASCAEFALWLLAAERAGVLSELEPLLVAIVKEPGPSPFLLQVAAQLVVLRPKRAVHWSAIAARAWPSPFVDLPRRGDADEALLIERAPIRWARACLTTLDSQGPGLALRFLGVARILWSLLRPSKLRRELLKAVRKLAEDDLLRVSGERFATSVRVANEARETLFLMGERPG